MRNYYLKFSFFAILLISFATSCTKDKIEASYPDELTIDNWEEFVNAPDEIIEDLMTKELAARKMTVATNDPDLNQSNARNWQVGNVEAWAGTSSTAGNWTGIADVAVSTTGSGSNTIFNGK